MNKIIHFLRLMRFRNLLIIVLTQYMIRWCIIQPLLVLYGLKLQMEEMDFFILVLSTVMIAAAGYIINDYFDIRVDRINKPDKIIVGRHIKRRVAMGAHLVINVIAFALGVGISLKVGVWKLSFFHLFSALSLWYYAVNFKRQLLIGNFVIAFLSALIPIIVGAFEVPLLIQAYPEEIAAMIQQIDTPLLSSLPELLWSWIMGYALFAFAITFAREIIKDMADVKGDKAVGCKSIPIMWGFKQAKTIVISITIIVILVLTAIQQLYLPDNVATPFYLKTMPYFALLIQLPLLISIYYILTGKNRRSFLTASNLSKIAMLFGILYALLVKYNILLMLNY